MRAAPWCSSENPPKHTPTGGGCTGRGCRRAAEGRRPSVRPSTTKTWPRCPATDLSLHYPPAALHCFPEPGAKLACGAAPGPDPGGALETGPPSVPPQGAPAASALCPRPGAARAFSHGAPEASRKQQSCRHVCHPRSSAERLLCFLATRGRGRGRGPQRPPLPPDPAQARTRAAGPERSPSGPVRSGASRTGSPGARASLLPLLGVRPWGNSSSPLERLISLRPVQGASARQARALLRSRPATFLSGDRGAGKRLQGLGAQASPSSFPSSEAEAEAAAEAGSAAPLHRSRSPGRPPEARQRRSAPLGGAAVGGTLWPGGDSAPPRPHDPSSRLARTGRRRGRLGTAAAGLAPRTLLFSGLCGVRGAGPDGGLPSRGLRRRSGQRPVPAPGEETGVESGQGGPAPLLPRCFLSRRLSVCLPAYLSGHVGLVTDRPDAPSRRPAARAPPQSPTGSRRRRRTGGRGGAGPPGFPLWRR